ncbi:GtrA family protein [Neobacillus piezotolerans]|uniref:GtrA family protein n=1 Tax=Neobacillus piezotolerans TaxID=2259171 RepID=A0A3D8GRP8_9BACI|nr:GtrA family protein [Neobacillus piezotolerans]RDU36889.1 GtrA family protein [Neobacillus piezotolerans]
MIAANSLKQTNSFVRFALVGVANTAAGLLIMLTLLNISGASYWLSTFIGNAAGAAISYFLNRAFTFKSSVRFSEGAPKFAAVILVCYFASYWASRQLIGLGAADFLPAIYHDDAAVLAGSVLYTISNYFGQKKYVFRDGPPAG